MTNIMNNIKTCISSKLGLSVLSKQARQFIYTHFNVILFYTIPGMFINTFFFNQSGTITNIAIFQIINAIGTAIFMLLSSTLSIKTSTAFIIRVGIVFFNLFYILLLLLQNQAQYYVVILGIIYACANGFYWQGYNEMLKAITDEGNFDRTIAILSMVASIVNLIIPTFSGYIIVLCPNKAIGYSVVFALSFICSIYTTYISFKLPKYSNNTKSNITKMYKYIFTDRSLLCACIGEFLRGIRNVSFPLFLSIVFYRQVMNEGLLGINNTLAGLSSIIAFLVASKLLKPNNRFKTVGITSIILTTMFASLFLTDSPILLFFLTIANAALVAFVDNPMYGMFFTMFKYDNTDINFNQLTSGRELFFGIGRAIGILLVIFLSSTRLELASFAIIANATLFLMLIFYGISYKIHDSRII